MDTIKGIALIATFIGTLTIFGGWVSLWESTWQSAMEPTRPNIYKARIGPSDCLAAPWWKRQAGCRLI